MSCSTCKDKKQKQTSSNGIDHINLIPESIQNGDFSSKFLFKLIAFLLLIVGFPLIYLVVMYMVFVNFFIPKKDAGSVLNNSIESIATKYATFKVKKAMKKKEKEYKKNRDYKGDSELLNIEVFTNKEDNNTEDSE